ncbi:MAG: DUF4091 domain-containing protein [Spirochaeta sp.]|nr:DUF4091 domain-containing protein [Spirochaeta sp.]
MTRNNVRSVVFGVLVVLLALDIAALDAAAGDFAVTLHYPLIKRPLTPTERSAAIVATPADPDNPMEIRLAGGEYELFVIGIHPGAPGADEADDRAGGTALADLIIDSRTVPAGYRLRAYYLPPFVVERASRWFDSRGTTTGEWFDPVVPLNESRTERTLTFDLTAISPIGVPTSATEEPEDATGSRYLLVEVYAPRDAGAAPFPLRGYVRSTDGRVRPFPPLEIRPFTFDLPSEHTLPVLMGLEGDDVLEQHRLHGLLPDDEEALWLNYLTVLREHRIVPYNPFLREDFSWEAFESTALPLYHGELTPDGVPAPAIRFPDNPYPPGSVERTRFYRTVAARLRAEGLLERAFYYVDDEPLMDDYTELIADAREIRDVVPDLRTLVTEPYTPRLEGLIDIWCPDIPMYEPGFPLWPLYGKGIGLQPEFQVNHGVQLYDAERAAGRELWLYTCTSAQVLGFPSLFIDARPAAARVIPWLLHTLEGTGFLYFRMNQAYRDGNNPWENQYYFNANGDGTLLYPGYPGAPGISPSAGGVTAGGHRAVASLRMKILRDGLEDYEYLRLAEARGVERDALDEPAIAPTALRWEDDLTEIVAARNRLGATIEDPVSLPPSPVRFNQVSQPSLVPDYGYIPRWAAPREDGARPRAAGFGLLSYRHLLASALDTGHRTANVATRGRWQVYLQAGALGGLSGNTLDYGGYSAIGGTVSLETAQRLNRTWLIPYVGMEGGILTGSADRDTVTGFAGSVLTGVHIWSTPRTSLSIGGAWTHTTTATVPVAFRGMLAFDFVIGR